MYRLVYYSNITNTTKTQQVSAEANCAPPPSKAISETLTHVPSKALLLLQCMISAVMEVITTIIATTSMHQLPGEIGRKVSNFNLNMVFELII